MARDPLRRAATAMALLLVLGGRAAAADPAPASVPVSPESRAIDEKVRQVLAGLEAWSPPKEDEREATAACMKNSSSKSGQGFVPEDAIRRLEELYAGTRQGVEYLCGKAQSCSTPSSDQSLGPLQCALAEKLDFMRALYESRADVAACKLRALREVPWAKSVPDSAWPEVCRQLTDAILRDDMTLCTRDGALGRLNNAAEALADCRETLAFIKGSEACAVGPGRHKKGAMGPRDSDECRIAATGRAALASKDPRRCGGEQLCLAALRDPGVCGGALQLPKAADVLLAGDSSGCAGSARCLWLYESAALFRRNIAGSSEQMRQTCVMRVKSDLVKIRRDRMDSILKAQKAVKELTSVTGFNDLPLLQKAMMRMDELSRQAAALPPRDIPIGKGPAGRRPPPGMGPDPRQGGRWGPPAGMQADGAPQGFGGAGNPQQ